MRAAPTLAVLRGRQWRHLVVLPLAGVDGGALAQGRIGAAELALALASTAACLAFAYGLNGVAEFRTDRSPRKNPLVGRARPGSAALAAVAASALLGLALASALGHRAALAAALSLGAGALYSAGLRAKRRPFLGLVVNDLIFVPLCFLLWTPAFAPPMFAGEVLLFTVLLTQNQLLHELADRDEDDDAGAETTARTLGEAATRRLAAALAIVLGVIPWALDAPPSASLLVLALAALTAALSLAPDLPPAAARLVHRRVALVGGAALFVLDRL